MPTKPGKKGENDLENLDFSDKILLATLKKTLKINFVSALFKPPLFRDYIMSSGMCNVTRESCEYILKEKGPGNSICIVVVHSFPFLFKVCS